MIKVDRLDCPDVLKRGVDPASEGEFETKDSIDFYSDNSNHDEPYRRIAKNLKTRTKGSYEIYGDKTVREKLAQMFKNKCAYCESRITSVYNGDIEHFRPKAGYGDPLVRPGYYWLAADWDNLLFACALCNQTNTLKVLENGEVIEIVIGKLNQFPLEKEDNRLSKAHGQFFFSNPSEYRRLYNLEEGDRLLLKPCTDNVEMHFKYLDEGVMLPNDNLAPIEVKRADTSINVYALKRISLIHEREQKIIDIKAQITRVKEAMFNSNRQSGDAGLQSYYDEIFQRELEVLKRYKKDDQTFAGLARHVIAKYFPELDTL